MDRREGQSRRKDGCRSAAVQRKIPGITTHGGDFCC